MEPKQRLDEVFAVVFGGPIPQGAVRSDVPEWDSLKHMQLVFAIEEQFNVRFSEEEIPGLDSVARIAAALQQRNAA